MKINTKYTANSVPTQNLKAGNNIIQYKAVGKFSNDERTLLNQSLRDGYVYINEAYTLLQKAKADTLEKAETILGELEESTLEALLANIQQIQDKILIPKLVVLKEDYLDTEKDHVLASVKEDDSYTFTVYENFFDKKEFKDNRAGVIIHEIAHLCDIEEGADMYDINSAECLKNIILHLNDILTLDEIQAEYAHKQEPQERDDDILTYDDDQPRVPAGSPEGGQWTSYGSSTGGGSLNTGNGNLPNISLLGIPFPSKNPTTGYIPLGLNLNTKTNLGLNLLRPYDMLNPPNKSTRRNVYMEARKKRPPEKSFLDKAEDFTKRNLRKAKNTVKDSSLIALSTVAKAYANKRLRENPNAIKENPDFVKASTAFARGQGGTFNFDERSQWTKDLKKHEHIVSKKKKIISDINNNTVKEGDVIDISLSYSQEEKLKILTQLAKDSINFISYGKNGSPDSYTTGSIRGEVAVKKINYDEKTAELTFNLHDEFRMGSATRFPFGSWSIIGDNPTTSTGTTVLKNVGLNWTWREKVSFLNNQ